MKIKMIMPALVLGLCILSKPVFALDLEYLRENYLRAASDKKVCRELIDQLIRDHRSSVHLAYLGALQTIWAKHVFSPVAKLRTFKLGRSNIKKAIDTAPANTELRFIRLSVQNNCPGFLGYGDNIEEDRQFILDNQQEISSPVLKKMITELLKNR